MKVTVYARVSTESENQLNSLANQQKHYIEYCKRNNYEMTNMYVDEGLTATKLKREQFLNMLHDAGLNIIQDEDGIRFRLSKREPKFEYIITKDVSRFSRNVNAIQVVKMLRKKGVYVLFEQNNIDTKDDKYEFMLNLFLNFSQQESIDRSIKVRFGMKQRANEGKYHFGKDRLYGYQYNKETKEISIVPAESEIVKRVFNMYVNDLLGSRQIADIIHSEGHKTVNNKKWTATSIVRMLKQEKYTGNVHLLKYTYGDVTDEGRQRKLKNENEWILKNDIIPSIIETDVYLKAQEIMSGRSTVRGNNTPKNIFSKKLKCAKCGKNYIRTSQKQGNKVYYFYACANRRRLKECDNHSITLIRLENEMKPYQEHKLYEILNERKQTLNLMIKNNIKILEIKKKVANKRKESIRNKIVENEDAVDGLISSFINSSATVKKAVERKIETLEAERKQLELELLEYDESNIDAEIRNYVETLNHINETAQKKKVFTLEEVLSFISHILIDGQEIQIEFAYEKLLPFDDSSTPMKTYMQENMDKLISILDDLGGHTTN